MGKRPPSPPPLRPSSPVVLVPPLKKRKKTVSFLTGDSDNKAATTPLQPPLLSATPPASDSAPLSSSSMAATPPSPRPSTQGGIQLLPFASKPGEGNALIVPPAGRPQDNAEDSRRAPPASPQTTPTKAPGRRGGAKEASPRASAPPIMVCRTVQNLPLDHASMCRMAFEEAPPPPAATGKRARGRPRSASLKEEAEEEQQREESEQRLRLREQLGASSLLQLAAAPSGAADLSVLADVASKMEADGVDSEETETSDEAEEQKMEEGPFSVETLSLVLSPEGVVVLLEHNYCRAPVPSVAPPSAASKRTASREHVLLPADLNAISSVLEAPEEVIGEALPPRGDPTEYLSNMGTLCESEVTATASSLPPATKKTSSKGLEPEKELSKKRRRKDKENLDVHHHGKKQKEVPAKKQKKRKLEVGGASGSYPMTAFFGEDQLQKVSCQIWIPPSSLSLLFSCSLKRNKKFCL